MKCIVCNGHTVKKAVEYREFGTSLGSFKADVCSKCGETYFDEDTAMRIQQKSKDLGLFGLARKAKIAKVGNSIAIRIPKELAEFLKLEKGKEVVIVPEGKDELRITI